MVQAVGCCTLDRFVLVADCVPVGFCLRWLLSLLTTGERILALGRLGHTSYRVDRIA